MDTIISAIPQDNFIIEIVTSTGISGTFDVKPYFGSETRTNPSARMAAIIFFRASR